MISLNCKTRNTDNLIDLYRYSILEYGLLNAFQIEDKLISYETFDKDVNKMANFFKDIKRKAIQIVIDNSYYFAVAYFAVVISNNIAVLSNKNLETFSNEIKIERKVTEELVEEILNNKEYKTFKYYSDYDNQDICTIIFSSGTMKKQKGIMLSMKNLATTVVECLDRIIYLTTDKCINIIPLSHVFGLMELLTTFYSGACICILQSKYQFFYMLKKYNPNYLNLPPILVENLLKQINENGINIVGKNLRRIMCGGAYISDKIIDEYNRYKIKIYRCYGLSEAPCIATCGEYEEINKGVGKPLDCNSVIIDENNQILVNGNNVMLGYVNNTEEPFIMINNTKYLKTKDIGKFDRDGNLYIIGRIDNIISLKNGNKIPKEIIEQQILEIEGVRDCRVNNSNNDIFVEIVTEISEETIKEAVYKKSFGGNKIKKVYFVKQIEKNLLGKVMRYEGKNHENYTK